MNLTLTSSQLGLLLGKNSAMQHAYSLLGLIQGSKKKIKPPLILRHLIPKHPYQTFAYYSSNPPR
jgi:hypothetical protein